MNHHRTGKTRIWLLVPVLIMVAFVAAIWAVNTFRFPSFFEPRPRLPREIPGDLEFFYTAKTVVSAINATLLVALIVTYIQIYMKTRSEFTIGLVIFSVVLLLNALASNPFVILIFGYQPSGLGPFALLPDLFTFAALTVLLYLSIKY